MQPPRAWLAAALLLGIVLVYSPSIRNGFTYDDPSIIQGASELLSQPALAARLFSRDYFRLSGESTFRPMVTLTYMVDWQVGGGQPWAFHVQSLLWHLATVACLLALLMRLGMTAWAACAIAAIYGVHPALTEAVDAIAFREDVLVVAFGLLSVLAITSSPAPSVGRTAFGVICFAAALLAKESALVFLLLTPLTDWAIARRAAASAWRLTARWPQYVAFAVCAAMYLAVRFWWLPAPGGYGVRVADSLALSAATGLVAAGYYVLLFIYPHPLCADYRGVIAYVASLGEWRPWAAAALLAGLTVFACAQRRRNPLMLWGWLWFLVSLVPVLNLIPIPSFMAERFLYLPYVGLVVAVWTSVPFGRLAPRSAAGGAAAVLLLFSVLTWNRHAAWSSDETLWRTTLADFPRAQGALHGYGAALIESGRFLEGITYLRRVLDDPSIGPERRAAVSRELALAHLSLGQIADAITSYEASLASMPTSAAHVSLGLVLLRLDRVEDAERQVRAALRLQPDDGEAFGALGAVLTRARRMPEAIEAYRAAIRLAPSLATAHANLGVALASEGQPDEGMASLRRAITLDPSQAAWRYRLARLLHERGRTTEAVQELNAALQVDPAHEEARTLLTELLTPLSNR